MTEFTPGHVIAERYEVMAVLGAGGMGTVYLVEEISSKQRYALKTILASGATDRNLKRFEMETQATKLLNHPNLVQIYDFGFIDENQPYFVMDYCDGKDLSSLIKEKVTFSVEEAIDIFITICNALTFAHTQGVVHRDLKPGNVMISDGVLKVLDFGIAKVFRDETAFNTVTQTGEIFGSPYYMSPEQCHGKAVDLRSDIYSLGCMFFEALTGAPPIVGETAVATMIRHQSQEPLSLKEATLGGSFPSDLDLVISQMLAKNPAYRYPDLLQVAEDLRRVLKGEPVEPLKFEETRRPPSKKVLVGGVIAGVIAGLVCVGLAAYNLHPPGRESYSTVFVPIDHDRKLPGFENMREKLPQQTSFFSVLNPSNDKVRDFHFPVHGFGDFGHGDNTYSYEPARGLKKNVQIPISLHIKQDCAALAGFRNDEVSNLTLRGYMVTDKTTDIIKGWHEITYLNMDDTDIGNSSIANFKDLKKLNRLGVSDTNVTGDALLSLPLEQISLLSINHLKNVKVILPRLKAGNSIEDLSLIGDNITDDDLQLISEMQKLRTLSLLKCPITEKGVEYLAKLPMLNSLWIEGKDVSPSILSTFKKMKLTKLVIENCPWSWPQESDFRRKLKRGNKLMVLDIKLDLEKAKH